MRALLDVNVLVALLDPQSALHVVANEFLRTQHMAGWASYPLTENGCLRVLTNPRYPAPQTAAVVLARFEETRRCGNHAFWPDDISVTDVAVFDWNRLRGHQQITDVYLLALAVAHGGRLVTFDRRIDAGTVPGCGPEQLVVL